MALRRDTVGLVPITQPETENHGRRKSSRPQQRPRPDRAAIRQGLHHEDGRVSRTRWRSTSSRPGRSPSTSPSASAGSPAAASSRSTVRSRAVRRRSPCTSSPRRRRTAARPRSSTSSTRSIPAYAQALGIDLDNLLVSQPDAGEQALDIAEMLVRSNAVDVVVLDSVAALVTKAELEGDMGDTHVGLQARLMSQALRKLTSAISRSKCVMIFINQLREKIGVMFGSPETTSGGRALKFYASIRIDIRKLEQIKIGQDVVGSRTRAKVVKNKVAPPFRQAEFDITYGRGISKMGSILDVALERNFVGKSGSWYTYGESRIGQGRENAKAYLEEHGDVADETRVEDPRGAQGQRSRRTAPRIRSEPLRRRRRRSKRTARVAALALLAQRRLTEAQLWKKLAARGYARRGDRGRGRSLQGATATSTTASMRALYVEGARKAVGDARLCADLVKRGIDREAASSVVAEAEARRDARASRRRSKKSGALQPQLRLSVDRAEARAAGFPASLIYRAAARARRDRTRRALSEVDGGRRGVVSSSAKGCDSMRSLARAIRRGHRLCRDGDRAERVGARTRFDRQGRGELHQPRRQAAGDVSGGAAQYEPPSDDRRRRHGLREDRRHSGRVAA